jgi:hypothetical protein
MESNAAMPLVQNAAIYLGRVFKMGGTGDSPVPFGDPPNGTTQSIAFSRRMMDQWHPVPLRPTSRRTKQASGLC